MSISKKVPPEVGLYVQLKKQENYNTVCQKIAVTFLKVASNKQLMVR